MVDDEWMKKNKKWVRDEMRTKMENDEKKQKIRRGMIGWNL